MIARRWSIAAKLGCAIGGSVAAAVAAATLANAYLSGHIVQRAAERELQTAQAFFEASIGAEADRALLLADSLAKNPDIAARFAAQDRGELARILVPAFAALKGPYALSQLQFHLPPATSFFRAHLPEKFGDDLSSFRFTVLEVNRSQRPVAGLENGVGGLGMRGVVPVFHENRHVGSVEVGTSFGQSFFDQYKKATGADVGFFVSVRGRLQGVRQHLPARHRVRPRRPGRRDERRAPSPASPASAASSGPSRSCRSATTRARRSASTRWRSIVAA